MLILIILFLYQFQFIENYAGENKILVNPVKILYEKNQHYILSDNKEKVFAIIDNSSNKILYDLEYGHGPDEVSEATDFIILDNTIIILSLNGKLKFFSKKDLKYIKDVQLRFESDGFYHNLLSLSNNKLIIGQSYIQKAVDDIKQNILYEYDIHSNLQTKLNIEFWNYYDKSDFNDKKIYNFVTVNFVKDNILYSSAISSNKILKYDLNEKKIQKIIKVDIPNYHGITTINHEKYGKGQRNDNSFYSNPINVDNKLYYFFGHNNIGDIKRTVISIDLKSDAVKINNLDLKKLENELGLNCSYTYDFFKKELLIIPKTLFTFMSKDNYGYFKIKYSIN